ncbi:uncharacterized protein LOC120421478 isoform X2 [Culex pipiens pallens]|uniref:uncharacterized protein LOC120421478 isoform X2 n=1 Tax=Culex pipiens pallens TaxID=42434 RepID=UPI0019549C2E|nr:uncharacterized protein LOC120421478 isoform X2 [Culex pipiens pallens]
MKNINSCARAWQRPPWKRINKPKRYIPECTPNKPLIPKLKMAAYGRIFLYLIRNFFSFFLAHRMDVWRSRPALAYDPDVESGIRDDEEDDDLAELAVAYFGRLNELARASVVHEPRSLAELAFAAIPVQEPLDDWTSNQMETLPQMETSQPVKTGIPNLFGNTGDLIAAYRIHSVLDGRLKELWGVTNFTNDL